LCCTKVHNCLQAAVDVLPTDIEVLMVKIYKYLHIYIVPVTQLKSFCDFVNVDYKKLLQYGNTRFLSLIPATKRIHEMFQGLKSYFCSQKQCPTVTKKFLKIHVGEMCSHSLVKEKDNDKVVSEDFQNIVELDSLKLYDCLQKGFREEH
jgi:hypothetical protein